MKNNKQKQVKTSGKSESPVAKVSILNPAKRNNARNVTSNTYAITAAELAEQTGMSKCAVSTWLKTKTYAGLIKPLGKINGVNVFDKNNPLIIRYITERKPPQEKEQIEPQTGDWLYYDSKYKKERARRLEILNDKLREELIPRNAVKLLFGRVYATHTSVLTPLGLKLADTLDALPPGKDRRNKIQELIDNEVYAALESIREQLVDYLTNDIEMGGNDK